MLKYSSTSRIRVAAILLGIILLSGWLRFSGLDWGTDPDTGTFHAFHPDEATIIQNAKWLGVDLQQIIASYGKAPVYLLWALATSAGYLFDIDPFDLEQNRSRRFVHVLARGISAALGTLTVWILFSIGVRLHGVWTGLLSAAFLGCCAGHIQQSHYYTVEVSLTFWLCLAILLLLQMPSNRKALYLAFGVVCGLAIGTRLVGIWLGIPFLITHLWPQNGRSQETWRTLMTPQILTCAVSALAVTLACEPFLILDPGHYFSHTELTRLMPSLKVAKGEQVVIWSLFDFSTTPYLFYFTHLFRYALGVPLEIVALLGVLLALARRRRHELVILGWIIPYFLTVGGLHTMPIRYTTPLLPFLGLLGAWTCVEASLWLHRRWRLLPISALPVLSVGLPALAHGASISEIFRQKDSRIAAAHWIREHIPEGSVVLTERGGFQTFWMVPEARYRRKVVEANYFVTAEKCVPYWSQLNFLESKLRGVEWLVLIEENRMRQFLEVPDRYPIAYGFYNRLASGKLGFEGVASFKVSPTIFGWRFSEAGAEPTITAYDHPRVWVYRSTGTDVKALLADWTKRMGQDERFADRYIRAGVKAYRENDWEAAAAEFRHTVERQPEFMLGHLLLREVYLKQGMAEEAAREWQLASKDGNGITFQALLGLAQAGLVDEGTAYLDQFLRVSKGKGSIDSLKIAQIESTIRFVLETKQRETETDYLRDVRLNPDNVDPIFNLGVLYYRQGRYEQAASYFARVIELSPHDPEARLGLAGAYARVGRREDAIREFRGVLSINPEDAQAKSGLESLLKLEKNE